MLNALLNEAKSRGIQFFLSEEKLKVQAEKGAMTDELRAKIKTHKHEIIQKLNSLSQVSLSKCGKVITPAPKEQRQFPLSYAQQRLWVIDQLEGETPQYNMPTALKLTGNLNEGAMQSALNSLVERHSILRTVYKKENDQAVQIINDVTPVQIMRVELSDITGDALRKKVKQLTYEEAIKPFNLSRDPAFRVTLLILAPNEYVVMFTMHHIASDGWSVGLLTSEFIAQYHAFEQRTPSTLTPIDIQYSDYAAWQRSTISDNNIEQQFDYWKEYLRDIPKVHNLPTDKTRPAEQKFEGRLYRQYFNSDFLKEIKSLAKQNDVTLFIMLRSVFALLVGRWSDTNDVVIGSPVAGRTEAQLQPLMGCFINTLVFRNTLQEGTTFETFLEEDKANTLNAFDNQSIPYDILIERLKPERKLSYSPIIQIYFTLQNNSFVTLKMTGLEVEGIEEIEDIVKFELQLTTSEGEDGLCLDWRYSDSLFEASTIERLAHSYDVLLKEIIANPKQDIMMLNILPENDQLQLAKTRFAQSKVQQPIAIPALFQQQALTKPQDAAVSVNGKVYSYGELNEKATDIACLLQQKGIGSEDVVALCLEPSFEMLVAIVGIWKAGAAYVALEPEYPNSRRTYILENSNAKLVLTHSKFRSISFLPESIYLDEYLSQGNIGQLRSIDDSLILSSLAYIIYTSGSTGKPKGVMIEHRALANLAASMDDICSKSRNWGWLAAYVFDASLQGISRLAYGSCLSLFTGAHKLNDKDIITFLNDNKPDILDCTPGMVNAWFSMGIAHLLPDLVIGGEAISTELWAKILHWQDQYKRTAINVYGPAECCVNSTWTAISGDKPHIGQCIDNTYGLVVDSRGQAVPNGVVGELCIGGEGLGRGYINLAELTGQVFINDEIPDGDLYTLYKTGDLVRVRSDGNFEFIGRKDNQVKIHGYRVELGEIEASLVQLNGISDAIVEFDDVNNRLISYCALDEEIAPAASRLARLLEQEGIEATELYSQPDGLVICGHDDTELTHSHARIFSEKVYEKQGIIIRDNDCILDVGANVGVFSTFLFTEYDGLTIHSFEPVPKNYDQLTKNFMIYGNVDSHAHCLGLSDSERVSGFNFYPKLSTFSSIENSGEDIRGLAKEYIQDKSREDLVLTPSQMEKEIDTRLEQISINVQFSTISDQIRQNKLESIDLLKISTIGSELNILKGIETKHWCLIKQVVIDLSHSSTLFQPICDLLKKNHFDVRTEDQCVYALKEQRVKAQEVYSNKIWMSQQGLVSYIRKHLSKKLPDYMIPGKFLLLDILPITVNGKVDRKLLRSKPLSLTESTEEFNLTGNALILANIWKELLNVDKIGLDDNFFAMGGDSILLIQAVSRTNKAGIQLKTRQMFAHQTIAQLLPELENKTVMLEPQGEVKGNFKLLPIHHGFFNNASGDLSHFNQSILLETPKILSNKMVEAIMQNLLIRHDALRLVFNQKDGEWQGEYQPLDDKMSQRCVVTEPLPENDDELTERCDHYQQSLDLANGPLIKAVLFSGEEQGRLLFVVHHIVVDGVSWRILLADLEQAFEQILKEQDIKLGAKTSAFNQWGELLAQYAQSDQAKSELDHWYQQFSHKDSLPVELNSVGLATQKTSDAVELKLSVEETNSLLRDCTATYNSKINELLLAGVYLGMCRWTDSDSLRIQLEGHGREDLFEELSITETLGWFTTCFPVELSSRTQDIADVIKSIKETLRQIPLNGIGYGVLRYLAQDEKLVSLSQENEPDFVFNYLGQFDQAVSQESQFRMARESSGIAVDAERLREQKLGLNGMVVGGVLKFDLDYSTTQYSRATVEKIAHYIEEGLKEVIQHCLEVEKGDFTPSDFPLSTISMAVCDQLQKDYEIEKLYATTPLQKGMLFHSQLDKTAYVTQVYPVFNGNFDIENFHRAWQEVVTRHDIFRTKFVGAGEESHQLVVPEIVLPWKELDWSHYTEEEMPAVIESYRNDDKQLGFDINNSTLQRITIAKLAEDKYLMLWTFHHVLLDGWSVPLVYRELMEFYHAKLNNRLAKLEPVYNYEEYIKWLHNKDSAEAVNYWSDYLNEVDTPTFLNFDDGDKVDSGYQVVSNNLTAVDIKPLKLFASQNHTTVNCLFQLAWSYLLHSYCGLEKVTFGATVSGRPAEVTGIESMIGMFINMVPVKLAFEADIKIKSLLDNLQTGIINSEQFGHISLIDMQAQSSVSGQKTLFDTMIAFENYPMDAADELENDLVEDESRIFLDSLNSNEQTNYALTVIASLQEEMSINIGYMGEMFSKEFVAEVLTNLVDILQQIPNVEYISEIEFLTCEEKSHYHQLSDVYRKACQKTEMSIDKNGFIGPSSVQEIAMTELWKKHLSKPVNSIYDNFFDLGGNSLVAIQLVTEAKMAGWKVSVADLWKYQTIAGLCGSLTFDGDEPIEQQVEGRQEGATVPVIDIENGGCRVKCIELNIEFNESYLRHAVKQLLSNEQLNYRVELQNNQRTLVPAMRNRKEVNALWQIFDGVEYDNENFIENETKRMCNQIMTQDNELISLAYFNGSASQTCTVVVHELLIEQENWQVLITEFKALLESLSSSS
jgi:amino acid adenylation domain-containing protein/non-ribosomal peptide synthase protein (TIGR01720 family)/FkbM family methyltransferase